MLPILYKWLLLQIILSCVLCALFYYLLLSKYPALLDILLCFVIYFLLEYNDANTSNYYYLLTNELNLIYFFTVGSLLYELY